MGFRKLSKRLRQIINITYKY